MITTFKHKTVFLLMIALPLSGLWQVGQGTYIHIKASLAQLLLETAWTETLREQKEVKPWPWADTWPISRLTVPRLGISRIVLAGASGSTLAFGPGHFFGTSFPGETGYSVIAGHRDTHFRFLQKLKYGDVIHLQNREGITKFFRIKKTLIVDENESVIMNNDPESVLLLVTCYPFDAIVPGGPLRFIVIASLLNDQDAIPV